MSPVGSVLSGIEWVVDATSTTERGRGGQGRNIEADKHAHSNVMLQSSLALPHHIDTLLIAYPLHLSKPP